MREKNLLLFITFFFGTKEGQRPEKFIIINKER